MKKRILILAAFSFAITQGSHAMDRQDERRGSPEEALLAMAEGAFWLGEKIAWPFLACTRTKREKLEILRQQVKKDHTEDLNSHGSDDSYDSPIPVDTVPVDSSIFDEDDR